MLRFFRNIRRNLVSGNSRSKYLLYAFGEIVLVVIGILIALYVNDAQAENEERTREQAYLERFQLELQRNLGEIDRLLYSSDSTLVRIDSLLDARLGIIPKLSNETFNRLSLAATDYLVYLSSEATVRDLVGSGELNIIRDPFIREAIASWDNGLMVLRSLEGDQKKAFNDLLDYFKGQAEMSGLMRGFPAFDSTAQQRLMTDPYFFNSLTYQAIPLQLLQGEYREKQADYRELSRRVAEALEEMQD